MFEREIREQIIEAGRRLYQKGFVASNDGNISARVDDQTLIITPTGVCKGDLLPEQLLKVSFAGEVVSGDLKPTSEMKMHLAVYHKRPDAAAIVHAHPPKATAFAVARQPLDKLTLPEVIFGLGSIALAEYGTPSTEQVPQAVEKVVGGCDAVLLSNHGALTVGSSVMDAYFKMETLEHFAAITINARQIGGERELDAEEEKELFRIRSEVFGKKGSELCTGCGACENGPGAVLDRIPDCVYAAQKDAHNDPANINRLISEITTRVIGEINK